jgi:tRNA A-37 threonylcarbamoyl transferase component Bud32
MEYIKNNLQNFGVLNIKNDSNDRITGEYTYNNSSISIDLKINYISIIARSDIIELRLILKKSFFSGLSVARVTLYKNKLNQLLGGNYFKFHDTKNFFFFCSELQESEKSIPKAFKDFLDKSIKIYELYLTELSKRTIQNFDKDPVLNRVCDIKNYIDESSIMDESESDDSSYDDSDQDNEYYKTPGSGIVLVDPEFIHDLKRDPEVWDKFDLDFLDESTGEYHYEPLNSLEYRGFIYKLNPEIQENILSTLVELYAKGKQFKNFPKSSIMVSVHNSVITSFKFAFNVSKILLNVSDRSSIVEYQQNMRKGLMNLVAEILSDKNSDSTPFELNSFESQNFDSDKLLIGSGGFGSIYTNKLKKEEVVIKIPKQKNMNTKECNEQTLHELRIMKTLKSKYIVNVLGHIVYKGLYCLVLEYCKSKSLKFHSTLSHDMKISLLSKVAIGIGIMHKNNVCHYDLKPHNILLKDELTPKIIDFGLSVQNGRVFHSGCTTEYADPRKYKLDNPGFSADIWAFGMTIYQTLLNKPPFYFIDRSIIKENKKKFFDEIENKLLRPKFTPEFEAKYPDETILMKNCWNSSYKCRPNCYEIIDEFKKIQKRKINF